LCCVCFGVIHRGIEIPLPVLFLWYRLVDEEMVMSFVHIRIYLVLIVCFMMILNWGGAVLHADQGKIEVGEPFPDIVLPALEDGSARRISDYRGHKLILHVFASW